MNLQLSTLNRILIIGGLFFIIALLGFFFVVQPKKQQESVTRAQIADMQAQYDNLKRVADQKPLYLAFTDQVRKRLKGVEVTADPRLYIPSFLKQVEDLAGRDGLIVTSVTPQATPSPSPAPSGAPSPGPAHPPNLPGPLAQPFNQVARGVGVQNPTTTGETAEASPRPGVTPAPGATGPTPAPQASLSPERAAALAYLNQSFSQVPVNMEFDGRYENLERFLRDLAKFQKLIGVGDMTIGVNGNSDVGESPHLKISLPLIAYELSSNAAPSGPLILPTPTPKPGGKR
ncbi:MAG: type 4a pilus biogenesis protein PilO [Candidatus Eremiobacteraeota bacterium]|nr:type 4a pilus biogenesis protein PilO [Candidatus Eremiobacteraeota bacterium]MBV8367114.1 type 4a pilus biogenesis protein PilO [Candidatus Eremiobacteraeota bacterium]